MDHDEIKMIKIPSWVVLVMVLYSFFNYALRKDSIAKTSFDPSTYSARIDSIKDNPLTYPDSTIINSKQINELLERD